MDELIRTIGQAIIDAYNTTAAQQTLPSDLAAKNAEIDALKRKLADAEKTINSMAEENANRSRKNDELRAVVQRQEEELRGKKNYIMDLTSQIDALRNQAPATNNQPLMDQLTNVRKKLTAAQNQVKSHESTIAGQKLTILDLEGKLHAAQRAQPTLVPSIQVGRVAWNAEEIQKMVKTNVEQAQEIERLKRIPKDAEVITVNGRAYDIAGIHMLLNTIAQLQSEIQGLRSTVPIVKVKGRYTTLTQIDAMSDSLDAAREQLSRNAAIAKRAESTLRATRQHIVTWRARARAAEEKLKKYTDVEDFERRRGTMLSAESRVSTAEKNAEYYKTLLETEMKKSSDLASKNSALSYQLTQMTDDRNQWRGKAAELMNGCKPSEADLKKMVENYIQEAKHVTMPDNCVVARIVDPSQVKLEIGGDEFPACDVREAFAALANVNKGLCVIDGVIYYYKDIVRLAADNISKQESIRVVTDTNNHITAELARLRPLEQENAELKKRVRAFEIEKKIRDGRAKANGIAASPAAVTTAPNTMKPGVAYMTTPVGLLPIDSDGMRYLVDKLALYMSVNQELNKAVLDMADSVKKAIERA